MRLALLTEIPAPFRIPLFNALAAQPDEVDLEVLFLAERDPRRPLRPAQRRSSGSTAGAPAGHCWRAAAGGSCSAAGVARELDRFDPDVVAASAAGTSRPSGQAFAVDAGASAAARALGREHRARRRPERQPCSSGEAPTVRAAAGFFVPGPASADYVAVARRRRDERIVIAPNAVDLSILPRPIRRARRTASARSSTSAGSTPEKGLDVLLRAFEDVPGRLVLVGGGHGGGQAACDGGRAGRASSATRP